MKGSRLWVFAYDIADNRRRRLIDRHLRNFGSRVQESVFEAWLDASTLQRVVQELRRLAHEGDRIACYPQCLWCEADGLILGLGRRPDDDHYWIL